MYRLFAEIHEVLGSRDYVEFDDFAKLEYMGQVSIATEPITMATLYDRLISLYQVLKETLRLYPPL